MFIAAGSVGLAYHAGELRLPLVAEVVGVCLVRLLAIFLGVFLLRGHAWARWGIVAWLGYHVVLSVFHTPFAVMVHSVLLAAVGYFLFRPGASAYLRSLQAAPPPDATASR